MSGRKGIFSDYLNEAEWNLHYGTNHNGKPYMSDNKWAMYSRETGHFGSGTYFSTYTSPYDGRAQGDVEKLKAGQNQDPHFIQVADHVYRVDFDLYKNLYRVHSKRQGDILISMLRRLNAFHNSINANYTQDQRYKLANANYNNALNYQQIKHNADALNLKCPSYLELTRMAQNHTGIQSFSTVFMEYNGFNGVNVSGVDYYDNSKHGSVIYDLSKTNTDMEEVTPNSLFTVDTDQFYSDTFVFNTDDDEMMAMRGKIFNIEKLNDMPTNKAMRILKNSIQGGNMLEPYQIKKLNNTLQQRFLRLFYGDSKTSHGMNDANGTRMFESCDADKYCELIVNNNAFYWVNYNGKSSYSYTKEISGFVILSEFMFHDSFYEDEEESARHRKEVMDSLKTYLTRDMTEYETKFYDENSKPYVFDCINRNPQLKGVMDLTERIDNRYRDYKLLF